MSPSSKRDHKAPTRSHPETVVLSKTDALGDQIIGIGLANALLQYRPRARLVWFVRTGNESLASLLKGSRVYRPDLAQPPDGEAKKALHGLRTDRSKWARVVFIPIPINPYQQQEHDLGSQMEWWIAFCLSLEVKIATVGSTTRNWLDQVLVASTRSARRIGFGPSPGSQELIPWHLSLMGLRRGQKLLTEEIAFPEDLNERERLHLLANTVCRKEIPFTIAIKPHGPQEPIDLTGVDRVLAIAPGAGDRRRSVKTSTLCDAVAGFLGSEASLERNCLIIEGPLDRAITSEVSKELKKRGIDSNTRRFEADDLPTLVALLRKTPMLLTHETLYAQLAAITDTPTVAIWGLGHWRRFFPDAGTMTIVHTSMLCQNCGWHCCLDRWHCITDISAKAITEGLLTQWRHRRDTGIRYVKCPSPVPEEKVLEKIKRAGFRSFLLESESESLREWNRTLSVQIADLRKWAKEERKLRRKSESLFADADKRSDAAKKTQKEEHRLRVISEKTLRETEIQRNNAKKVQKEEHRLRITAEALLRETEKQRDDKLTWAEQEHDIRKNAEALFTDAERQRDDAKKAQEEEYRLRVTAESLRKEAERQRDDMRAWAEEEQRVRKNSDVLLGEARKAAAEEHQLRVTAESLLRESENQRNEACAWAEQVDKLWKQLQIRFAEAQKLRDETARIAAEERQHRESAEARLQETRKQRDDLRNSAAQERQLRHEAEALRIETEKQRDDQREWAELERKLRLDAESLRAEAEQQRDEGTAWAREERKLHSTADALLADAEKQRDDLRAWAEEERELRQSAQDLLHSEEGKTQILRENLKEKNKVLTEKITMIEETAEQLAALTVELRQTQEARQRYERLYACRFAADIADRWNRGKRRMSKK